MLRLDSYQLARGEIKMRDLAKRAAKLGLDEPRLRTVAEEMVPVPWPGLMGTQLDPGGVGRKGRRDAVSA